MRLTQTDLIMRYLVLAFFWACIYCEARGDDAGKTHVFFVQNTHYKGKDNLDDKSDYKELVSNLYQVFENYVSSSPPNEDLGNCLKVVNQTKNELHESFKTFVTNNSAGLAAEKAKLFIVLNGHGVQFDTSKTYAFKTIDEEYVLLNDFANMLEKKVDKDYLPDVVFLVFTCRTKKQEDSGSAQDHPDISGTHLDLQHVIIYACKEFDEVIVDESTVLKCVIEALSGAADAEKETAPEREDFHNGEVSLLEIWKYIEWRTQEMGKPSKAECVSYCEGEGHVQNTWFSAVTKVRRAFLKPSDFEVGTNHPQLLAIGDLRVNNDYDSTAYPKFLPDKYRYKFSDTDFRYGTFHYCTFKDIDFSNAKFSSGAVRGTEFENCSLSGATIGGDEMRRATEEENFRITR